MLCSRRQEPTRRESATETATAMRNGESDHGAGARSGPGRMGMVSGRRSGEGPERSGGRPCDSTGSDPPVAAVGAGVAFRSIDSPAGARAFRVDSRAHWFATPVPRCSGPDARLRRRSVRRDRGPPVRAPDACRSRASARSSLVQDPPHCPANARERAAPRPDAPGHWRIDGRRLPNTWLRKARVPPALHIENGGAVQQLHGAPLDPAAARTSPEHVIADGRYA